MPTATERAHTEKNIWAQLAGHWTRSEVPDLWDNRPPTEADVIVFHDPSPDLTRRARQWGHDLPGADLGELARFAAALALAEAEGWESNQPDVATRAFEARRFLLGDRIVHWAIPWLDSMAKLHTHHREQALSDRNLLLGLADEARVAPALPGSEGLLVTGEDSYGPVQTSVGLQAWLESLWSGALLLATAHGPTTDLTRLYENAAVRWREMAEEHPGSAQLWWDLSRRAEKTSTLL